MWILWFIDTFYYSCGSKWRINLLQWKIPSHYKCLCSRKPLHFRHIQNQMSIVQSVLEIAALRQFCQTVRYFLSVGVMKSFSQPITLIISARSSTAETSCIKLMNGPLMDLEFWFAAVWRILNIIMEIACVKRTINWHYKLWLMC